MNATTVMDTEAARHVLWPFNRNKGWAGKPIGELLDAGEIHERDLRWAEGITRKNDVRQACQVLLGIGATEVVAPAVRAQAPSRFALADELDEVIESPKIEAPVPAAVPLLSRLLKIVVKTSAPVAAAPSKPDPVAIKVTRVATPLIPATCPVCGSATEREPRWDSYKHGAGWRCAAGLTHFLETTRLAIVKAFFAADFPVIPAVDGQSVICRRDYGSGEYGYLPQANQPVVIPPGMLLVFTSGGSVADCACSSVSE